MEKYKITFECSRCATFNLIELLRHLKHLGDIGSSRTFSVEDKRFTFDGDGSDSIYKISVNDISLTDIDVIGIKKNGSEPDCCDNKDGT
jgi:hypothetical protein